MSGLMSGWNLPPGCFQKDIDRAMGDYDEERDFGDLADELYDLDQDDALDTLLVLIDGE